MHAKRAVAFVAFTAIAQLSAQTPDWERVRSITPGQRVSVITRDRSVIEGRFQSWSPSAVAIVRRNRTQTFAVDDIRMIQEQRKGSRWKGAMWGAIAGFAAAFSIGAAQAGYLGDQNNPRFGTRMEWGAAFGMFGGGIGAAIGALAGGTRSVTVYREQRR